MADLGPVLKKAGLNRQREGGWIRDSMSTLVTSGLWQNYVNGGVDAERGLHRHRSEQRDEGGGGRGRHGSPIKKAWQRIAEQLGKEELLPRMEYQTKISSWCCRGEEAKTRSTASLWTFIRAGMQ